jgi:hypothetical protein
MTGEESLKSLSVHLGHDSIDGSTYRELVVWALPENFFAGRVLDDNVLSHQRDGVIPS